MSYQVIARKWRPQAFGEIVGQKHVTQTLENAIRAGRVAHAYIFSGIRGVGKTTTARILAKALNCEKTRGKSSDPCNECDSCKAIAAGTSLDVLEIDAASNRGIDQIRDLREMVRYAPAAGQYKVVILDEAHQLTDEASNALLKTLEEPPENVVFILATTRAEDLAETLKSRAQFFQFRALSFGEISDALERIAKEEKLKIERGAVAVLARAAEGSLRDSLSLLEQAIAYCGKTITNTQVRELLGVVPEDVLDELVAAVETQSTERALGLVQQLIADGQNLQHFCRESIRHFRNLLVARVCAADSELITSPRDERPKLQEQAQLFSEEDLTRYFQILMATDDDLRRKPDPRLHLELGLLKLVTAARLAPFEEVLAELRGAPPRVPPPQGRGGKRVDETRGCAETEAQQAPAKTAPKAEQSATHARVAIAESASPNVEEQQQPSAGSPEGAPNVTMTGLSAEQQIALLTALERQKFLGSMALQATRWRLEENEMQLFFAPETRPVAEMLQSREPMEKLRAILAQVAGRPLRVCVKLEPVRTDGMRGRDLNKEVEEDPNIRAMLERFGGKISSVRRRSGG